MSILNDIYGTDKNSGASVIETAEHAIINNVAGKKVFNVDSGGNVVNPASADYQAENVSQLYTVIENQTNGSQKNQIVDDNSIPIDFSTSTKQDILAGKIDTLITELQQKTEPNNVQMSEVIPMLRSILTAIANPAYVDKSANQMRSQVTGSLTTVTTVTTVTNLTNIGSFPADHLQRMNNMTAWATNIRNLIT